MPAVTFDPLEFVKTLQAAGMPAGQAEAIASAVRKAQDSADVATKGDIVRLESKFDQFRWIMGFVLAAVLSLVVKTFF